jgi:multiple sugar transport system substrate-binding protein
VVALAALGAGGAAGGGGILGACAPGGGSGGPPAPAGSGQPARLVWLNWEGGAAQLEGNTKTIESFQAQHPRITVENAAQTAGGATYWDKHAALKASGAPPDLWEWEPQHVVDNVLRKQVLDLQPLVARDRYDLSDFFVRGIDQYRYRSGLWGLPRDFPNRELAYSVTAFEKEGLRPPPADWKSPDWTWDAFLDAARRLTKPDSGQWGFNTGRGIRMWAVWVWSNGGEVIDEQRLVCTLDQAPAAEGLQFLQDLIHRHRVWPQALPQGASFQGGQVAIQESAPAGMGNLRRDIGDKFAWDVVMHPRGRGPAGASGGKYVAAGGGAGWAADAATASRDATWAFLKHLTSSEEQIRMCQLGGTIGSRRSVMTNACFLQTPPKNVKLFIDGTDYLHVDVRVAGWTEVSRILDEELKSLWDGSQPGRQVAAAIKARVDPVLKAEAQKAGA